MSASDNYYILLDCFLDPPETDWNRLEAHINAKKDEWNKKRNNPDGTIYQRLSERVDEIKTALSESTTRRIQAEEARGIKLSELDARVRVCTADGSIAPEQVQLLLKRYTPFFTEATIRSRIKVPEKAVKVVLPPPTKPVEDPLVAKFASKMKQTSTCLQVLGVETVYEALGRVRTTVLSELKRASEELGDRGQKASKKTAETNAQKELGGLAKEFFQDELSKRSFETAWAQFRYSQKLEEDFGYRIIERKEGNKTERFVSEKNYDVSLDEALQSGMRQDEAEWFVYNFYVNKRKCADPRTDRSGSGEFDKVYCPNCFAANESSANSCAACGYSLKTQCPRCRKTSALADHCPSCGFSFVDMENAKLQAQESKTAYASGRLDDAIAAYQRAFFFWSETPGLEALGTALRDAHAEREYRLFEADVDAGRLDDAKRRRANFSFDKEISPKGRDYQKLADDVFETIETTARGVSALENLCQKNRFFLAKKKYAEISAAGLASEELDRLLERIDAGIARAQAELKSVAASDEREKKLTELIERFPDFEEARSILKTQDTAPSPGVDAFDRQNGIEVRWSASPSLGEISYRVMRSELLFLNSGGSKIASPIVLCDDTEDLIFLDRDADEFKPYVYSVVAFRSSTRESSETRSAPVIRVGEIHDLQIAPDSKKLTVSWRVSENVSRIEVTRKDLSAPDRESVRVADVSRAGFVDSGLVDDVEYQYGATLYYKGVSGKEEATGVLYFSATPAELPKPLDNWQGSYAHRKIELRWAPPPKGEVHFFESTKPFVVKRGDFFGGTLADLAKRLGEPLTLKPTSEGGWLHASFATSKDAATWRNVLPVVVVGRNVVIGRERRIDFVETVGNLAAQLVDDDLFITWDWSSSVDKCLVLYSSKKRPTGIEDRTCNRVLLTKQEYDRECAWVRKGYGERPLYVMVVQVYENDGKKSFSKPVLLFTEKIYVSYRFYKRESLFGIDSDSSKGALLRKLRLWNLFKLFVTPKTTRVAQVTPLGNGTQTPKIIVVKQFDRKPYRRDDGDTVATIPAADAGAFEISMDDLFTPGGREYFRLFCANLADSKIYALLEDR